MGRKESNQTKTENNLCGLLYSSTVFTFINIHKKGKQLQFASVAIFDMQNLAF